MIGTVLTAAATATWMINNPESLQAAIDTIVKKTKETPEKVSGWIKSIFATEIEAGKNQM